MKKKILCLLIVVALFVSILPTTAFAASYPLVYSEHFSYEVAQGDSLAIKFTVFREYKNEELICNLYRGKTVNSGVKIGSSETSFYSSGSSMERHPHKHFLQLHLPIRVVLLYYCP